MSDLKSPRTLTGSKKNLYALGALAQILPLTLFNSYSFQYYVYTIGLDAMLVSIGIFIGLFVYAIGAPIIGAIVDNRKPSKRGKRKPFILIGLPFGVLCAILNWTPPKVPEMFLTNEITAVYWPTAIYFWVICAILNLAMVTTGTAYLSMLPEQCQTKDNQIEVAAIQGMFNLLGSVLALIFPMVLQSFLEDPKKTLWFQPSGQFLVKTVPWVGGFFGVITLILYLISYFSIDESFLLEEGIRRDYPSLSFKHIFKKMLNPLNDYHFKIYLISIIFLNLALRVLVVNIVPLLTYVFELNGFQFILFVIIIIPFAFFGLNYWNNQAKRVGLIKAYSKSMAYIVVTLFLTQIFLIQFPFWVRFFIGEIIFIINIMCLVGGFLFPTPIVGMIIDKTASDPKYPNKDEVISRISGAYFGVSSLFINIASGVANLVVGAIFVGNNAIDPMIILFALSISGIFYFLTAFFVNRIKLNENLK